MKSHVYVTVTLGDLVVDAFDRAARHSIDPREVSRLATLAIAHIFRRLHPASIFALTGQRDAPTEDAHGREGLKEKPKQTRPCSKPGHAGVVASAQTTESTK